MKRFLLIALPVVCLAMAATFWAMKKDKAAQPHAGTPPLVAVEVCTPSRATLTKTVEVFGSLSPKNASDIKSEIPGLIKAVRVKEWESVKAGDVLLEIDPTDLKLTVGSHEAGLKMSRAQLLQARVDLSRARREWQRAVKLKDGGLVTGQELDERKSALELAEAKVSLADAAVAQSESQTAEARHNLGKTLIKAPIDGTVSQRRVDNGDWVDKGNLLFSVVDNRVLDFTANVSAVDLPLVVQGQTLRFTVDGLPERVFHGRVKHLNPLVNNADRTGRIMAEVANEDGVLKGGSFARGLIVVRERPDALTLPKDALMGWNLEKETARVFIVDENDLATVREVRTGLASEGRVEIVSGLSEPDRVILRGGFNLRAGDKVQATTSGDTRG